jgi:hypothetical protein
MGSLKPGATYIYERVDDTVYAREVGAPPSDRVTVGYNFKKESTVFGVPLSEVAEMIQIFTAAETNPALQKALERAKIIYYLSKKELNE